MENLEYKISDKVIANILGIQNFTNGEAAILELVKNSYDANATTIVIKFERDKIIVHDNGIGMDANDIRTHWMNVGNSNKNYFLFDKPNERILAGSKGIGRFALARLGNEIILKTKTNNNIGCVWHTNWEKSTLDTDVNITTTGTVITILHLRDVWNEKKISYLKNFISRAYNNNLMSIFIEYNDNKELITSYFNEPILGVNCISIIKMHYDAYKLNVNISIDSDEFEDSVDKLTSKNIKKYINSINVYNELVHRYGILCNDFNEVLHQVGSFEGEFYFNRVSSKIEQEKWKYKYASLNEKMQAGIILYRNAFSLMSYDGEKDWLGLAKRARKSPAAASHPTGAWRVRENQISGKVIIDKERNKFLEDLSNRQGIIENIFYNIFVDIIIIALTEFERYRQGIIRDIASKQKKYSNSEYTIINKIIYNTNKLMKLTHEEAADLSFAIKQNLKDVKNVEKEKSNIEKRYKYDVRILNVLATMGLKASSIAHEIKNSRISIETNNDYIIRALQGLGMWDILNNDENTKLPFMNVPYLLENNKKVTKKIVSFMGVLLSNIEKNKFNRDEKCILDVMQNICATWEKDYSWLKINLEIDRQIKYLISEDVLSVIFDNLILNSVQQNENKSFLIIDILIKQEDFLLIRYKDNGVGLAEKYLNNPFKILEVHETTRINGHGLGMWIVNNTVVMSGGKILDIKGNNGFYIELYLGGKEYD